MTKWRGMELCHECCEDTVTSLQLHYTWPVSAGLEIEGQEICSKSTRATTWGFGGGHSGIAEAASASLS